jgi:hypothetical protein
MYSRRCRPAWAQPNPSGLVLRIYPDSSSESRSGCVGPMPADAHEDATRPRPARGFTGITKRGECEGLSGRGRGVLRRRVGMPVLLNPTRVVLFYESTPIRRASPGGLCWSHACRRPRGCHTAPPCRRHHGILKRGRCEGLSGRSREQCHVDVGRPGPSLPRLGLLHGSCPIRGSGCVGPRPAGVHGLLTAALVIQTSRHHNTREWRWSLRTRPTSAPCRRRQAWAPPYPAWACSPGS